MESENEYWITEWSRLFEQIGYAHEAQYPPEYWVDKGVEYISFYKLTLTSEGDYSYKSDYSKFDPALWPRVKLLYKLFEKDGAIDTLYGKK